MDHRLSPNTTKRRKRKLLSQPSRASSTLPRPEAKSTTAKVSSRTTTSETSTRSQEMRLARSRRERNERAMMAPEADVEAESQETRATNLARNLSKTKRTMDSKP